MVLYKEFNAEVPSAGLNYIYLIIVFGLIQIILGINFNNKFRTAKALSERIRAIVLTFPILNFVLGGYVLAISFLSIVYPIYSLSSELPPVSPSPQVQLIPQAQ